MRTEAEAIMRELKTELALHSLHMTKRRGSSGVSSGGRDDAGERDTQREIRCDNGMCRNCSELRRL